MSFLEYIYKTNKIYYLNLKNYFNYDKTSSSYYLLDGGAKKKIPDIDLTKTTVSEKELISYIEQNTKATYRASYDDDGKLDNNIANTGLSSGQIAIRGGGEYNGLEIRATEDIKPLLTDARVIRAIKHLIAGEIPKAIGVLRLNEEIYEYSASNPNDQNGLGLLYSTIKYWLERNDIPVPKEYTDKAIDITSNNKFKKLIEWIESYIWSPIRGKFEIVEIGYDKDHSIVPEEWLGREFNDAYELHKAMDKLDWRKGKPAVTFCIIYGIQHKPASEIYTIADVPTNAKVKIGMTMFIKKGIIQSNITIFDSTKNYKDWFKSLPKNCDILMFELNGDNFDKKISIAFHYNELFESVPKYEKKRTVGLLVSTMQKLLRRGPSCSEALEEVLREIWRSPAYNLPEQQFLRVSACRQLCWRLFITCIEDIQAFETKDPRVLQMPDLAILGIIANGYVKSQFNEFVFNKLLLTALSVQRIDKKWDYMSNEQKLMKPVPLKNTDNNLLNSFVALQNYMPVRSWDDYLLLVAFNNINEELVVPTKLTIPVNKKIHEFSDPISYENGLLAGCDMHAYPNILIVLQGSLPFIPYDSSLHTTKSLWNFIWTYSSSVNYRLDPLIIDKPTQKLIDILKNIQRKTLQLYGADDPDSDINKIRTLVDNYPSYPEKNDVIVNKESDTPLTKRVAFILLFGQRKSYIYKKKRYDIVIAGYDIDDPEGSVCKVKYVSNNETIYIEGELRRDIESDFLKDFSDTIELPDAPLGYDWIWSNKKKVNIKSDIVKNEFRFYVDGTEISAYDASNVLIKLDVLKPLPLPNKISKVIKRALYLTPDKLKTLDNKLDDYQINMLMREIHEKNYPLFDWAQLAKDAQLPNELWRSVYIKLYNNYEHDLTIGPVDGKGNALRDSINYMYEGTIWRVFNMLSMLYPKAIKTTHAIKSLKFRINRNTPQYMDLLRCLDEITFGRQSKQNKKSKNKDNSVAKIEIVSKLWDHQQATVDKIIKDVFILGKRGFGDASSVGSGKTLTALAIMAELYNNKKTKLSNNKSFLVLLPTTYLFKTWEDEITKHCKGYHIVFQNANGSLTDDLQKNSILITTLGRMRDHPLSQSWIFVVIDECLTVQNKNALHTEEAWRQILVSQHGVFMMSATFFRTRFDKLFYMIKMLNTGLPEEKKYLDAILAESIVMNIPKKTREWITNYNPFELESKSRKLYDELLATELTSEKLYIKLQSFLFDNFDYVETFRSVIIKCEKLGRRCLVYTRSKNEADLFASRIKNLSRFPDISGKHIVISYVEGTYGLNQLTFLNTIVTRFMDPDKIPQAKGRLDRPNQTHDTLYLEYIYIKDTIDRGGLMRLELANSFYKDYLMPLAEFYDIALGKK
jgi:hypothetical protein